MPLGTREILLELRAYDNASQAIRQVGDELNYLGRSGRFSGFRLFAAGMVAQRLGRALEEVGSAALGTAVSAVKMAATFDYEMAQVQTQAQLTRRRFVELKQGALDVSEGVAQSTTEVAQGLYDIFSSIDVNYREALDMIEQFSKAATAGGTDVRTTTRGVIQILNAFGMSADDTRYVLDVLFQELRRSTGTFEELVAAWGNVVGAGKMAGQTLQTLAGSVSFLTKRGRTQAQATISVSRALDQLTRASNAQKLKDVLGVDIFDRATGQYKQLNVIIEEMAKRLEGMSQKKVQQIMYEIFGAGSIQANRFFRLALPNFRELNAEVQKMSKQNVTGQFRTAWQIMRKTPQVQFQILTNRVKSLAISIGELLLPEAVKLVRYLKDLVATLDNLDPGVKKTIGRFLFWGGIITLLAGKVLSFSGSILQMMSLLTFMGSASAMSGVSLVSVFTRVGIAIGGLLLVVGLLALGAKHVWDNWDKYGPKFQALWETVKEKWEAFRRWLFGTFVPWVRNVVSTIWDKIVEWKDKIVEWWNNTRDTWIEVWNTIKEKVTNAWNAIADFAGEIWDRISTIWDENASWIEDRWDSFTEALGNVWEVISNLLEFFTDVWNRTIGKWGDDLWEIIKSVFRVVVETIGNALQVIRGIIDVVLGILTLDWRQIWEGIKNIAGGIWDEIVVLAGEVWNIFKRTLTIVWETIAGVWETIWQGIKDFFIEIWNGILVVVEWAINRIIDGINLLIDAANVAQDIADVLSGPAFNYEHFGKLSHIDITGSSKTSDTGGGGAGGGDRGGRTRRGRVMIPSSSVSRVTTFNITTRSNDPEEITRELDWYRRTRGWD